VPDARVEDLLGGCRALVVTATEEFGIAAVEAQAAGRPVIAPAAGGALETVTDGVTGRLYAPGSGDALAAAVEDLDALAIDPQACLDAAARFDVSRFRRKLGDMVDGALESERPARPTRRRQPRRAPRLRAPV
jgi:glycosyltransferase involved in cell wall biosynthesis